MGHYDHDALRREYDGYIAQGRLERADHVAAVLAADGAVSIVVGESGPEMFVPSVAVEVVPAAEVGAEGPPVVEAAVPETPEAKIIKRGPGRPRKES